MVLWTVEELVAFESKVASLFNRGEIRAPVHLSNGNEAAAIEVFKEVKPGDWVFCSWRSHYQALLKGVPEQRVMDEILSGRSISLCFPEYRFFSSAIVGGHVPLATGVALSLHRSQNTSHVWCFIGDMTSETGIVQTAVRYAEGHDLPITFVIEDNGLSVLTETRKVWKMKTLRYEERPSDKVRCYKYSSKYPHAGAGVRVQF
jgi:TPP-dependent pyruvate/acetoin dehydrogenase alpha subunit